MSDIEWKRAPHYEDIVYETGEEIAKITIQIIEDDELDGLLTRSSKQHAEE